MKAVNSDSGELRHVGAIGQTHRSGLTPNFGTSTFSAFGDADMSAPDKSDGLTDALLAIVYVAGCALLGWAGAVLL